MGVTGRVDSEYLEWPYVLLPLSSGVFGVGYLLYLFGVAPSVLQIVPRSQLLFLTSQLSIALFAAYLVVVFVSTAQTKARTADRTRRQEAAMNQLTTALNTHLTMLAAWYLASCETTPESPPESYEAFFDTGYTETVETLDFTSPYAAGEYQSLTWLAWSAAKLRRFSEETTTLIEFYGDALDPAVVEALHSLANSQLTRQLITAEEADLPEHIPEDSALVLFNDERNREALRDHLELLLSVIESHDELGSSPVIESQAIDCWKPTSYPEAGCARADPERIPETPYYKFV